MRLGYLCRRDLEMIENGMMKKVDLSLGIVGNGEKNLSNKEKLQQLEKELVDALADKKSAMASGTKEESKIAREKVKKLKKEKKALIKLIEEEQNVGKANDEEIAALERKIEEATARCIQAEEDDDEEAEEAAFDEVNRLKDELQALLGESKMKAKLAEAKNLDEEINK